MMLAMTTNNGGRQRFERDYRANTRALRKARTKAKLTLKGLADKADINYTTISRIEKGHNRSPHWPTLESLAEALNTDVDDLVVYLDPDDPVPDEPGTTEENEARLAEVRREKAERDEQTRKGRSAHDTGDRTP